MAKKKSLTKRVEEAFDYPSDGEISRKRDGSGHFRFRDGYFYRPAGGEEAYANRVSAYLTKAGFNHTIVETGDHWATFKGGASLAKSSHLWVDVSIVE